MLSFFSVANNNIVDMKIALAESQRMGLKLPGLELALKLYQVLYFAVIVGVLIQFIRNWNQWVMEERERMPLCLLSKK